MGRRRRALALALLGASLLALWLPGCGDGERPGTPVAQQGGELLLQAAPQVIADRDTLQEVTRAYQQFWQDYAIALGTLDAGPLSAVAAQGALQAVQDYLQGLRNDGRAYLVTGMRHAPLVTALGKEEAQVEGTGALILRPVRAGTSEPLGDEREEQIRYVVRFERLDGSWKATAFSWVPVQGEGQSTGGQG